MNELPILYSFVRCPYAMRARLAIAKSGVQVQLREVRLRDKPAEMLEASPKGTVPVLVLPGGEVVDESLDIMRWALDQNDPDGWLEGIEEALELIEVNDGPFKKALDRYKYFDRYPEVSVDELFEEGMKHIRVLEERLQSSKYLVGDRFTMIDAALLPFIRQFAHANPERWAASDLVRVPEWLEAFKASELFRSIMTKRDPWKTGDPLTLFP